MIIAIILSIWLAFDWAAAAHTRTKTCSQISTVKDTLMHAHVTTW